MDNSEFLHRLRERPLPDDIPTAWYYSSPAYGLLARVVERASDVPYREFLTRSIFEPLAIRSTFAGNGDGGPNLAAGYTGDEPALSLDLDSMWMGTGDIWSTVQDLDRWNRTVLSEQLLYAGLARADVHVVRKHRRLSDPRRVRLRMDDHLTRRIGRLYARTAGNLSGLPSPAFDPDLNTNTENGFGG